MHPRLAKKIVTRVSQESVSRTSYRRDQVEAAFTVMGQVLPPSLLAPWNDAKVPVNPQVLADKQLANQAKRAAALEALEADRKRRADRKEAAIEQNRRRELALEDARETFRQTMAGKGDAPTDAVIGSHVQGKSIPDDAPNEMTVLEAEAKPIRGRTDKVAILDEVAHFGDPDYEGMTVSDLKAFAKDKGLSGYSTMKKAEIIALLQSA